MRTLMRETRNETHYFDNGKNEIDEEAISVMTTNCGCQPGPDNDLEQEDDDEDDDEDVDLIDNEAHEAIAAMIGHHSSSKETSNEAVKAMLAVNDADYNEDALVSPLLDRDIVDIFAPISYVNLHGLAKTFSISCEADEMSVQVGLNRTQCNLTFPTGSVCSFNGKRSPNNICNISGNLGDVYIFKIKKGSGGKYNVAITNVGPWEPQDSDFKRLLQ